MAPPRAPRADFQVADAKATFHQMVEALGASKAPLSVRIDVDHTPSAEEVQMARRTIGHVMADADVRGRLSSLKVEPLVRAASIVLEDIKRGKVPRAQREVAESICEYLDVLEKAFGAVPSVLNNRGLARNFAGDLPGASADLAAARRLAPGFEAARANEMAVLRKKGDHAHLERVAAEIEGADPGNAEALRALIDAKLALGRDRGEVFAIGEKLHGAKGVRPHDVLTVGLLASAAGREPDAERYLREYIALDPKATEGHVRLATALLSQGKFAEALAEYEHLTELDGPKHEYLLAIALIYDQMGRVSDAAAAFDFALEHASASDQDIIEHAFSEFRQRRGISKDGTPVAAAPEAPAAPAAPAPAPAPLPEPFAEEEEDLAAPVAAPLPAPDLDTDDFEPRAVGDAEIFGVPSKEEPIFPKPEAPPAPEPPVAPPAAEEPIAPPAPPPPPVVAASPPPAPEPVERPAPAKSREEEIVEALSAGESEAEAADDIMGDSGPVEPAPAAPQAPPPPPPEPVDARPARAPPQEAAEPEDAPGLNEAIVVAPPQTIVAEPPPPPPSIEPTVSVRAPPAPEPKAVAVARSAAPVVSSPPPAPADVPDEDLTAELEALAEASPAREAEASAEPEPFRRPTFDVDSFMANLESKTKDVFDHLYDGMLEARRKEPVGPSKPSSPYESAPPTELPSVQSSAAPPPAPAEAAAPATARAGPAPPTPVETAPPVMPALFKGAAREAIRESVPPADPAAFARAQTLASKGDDAAAESEVDLFLRSAPDNAAAWNLKGDLRERAGDEQGAVAAYRQAVKYDKGLKEAWNNLGVLLHLMGRLDEAVQTLESAVKSNPDDRHLWHNLGSTYHELGKLQDALAAFGRAIEIDPNDKVSHNNRGTTLFELGDFSGARASFEKAAALDPAFEQAHNNLGRTLEKLEDREGAVRSFEAALAVNHASRTALRNLARVLRALGRQGDAADAESRLAALGT